MGKKVIISETTMKEIVVNEILNESNLTKNEITNIIKDVVKNDIL